MFFNGRRMYFECVELWGQELLLSTAVYNFIDTNFFPLSSSQRSFLVLLDARGVYVNPIKRDFKSLLVIRIRGRRYND